MIKFQESKTAWGEKAIETAKAIRRKKEGRPKGRWRTWGEIGAAALGLGLWSFGGPTAHLGYFRREYVEKRRWLGEAAYAELVAIAQFLPGPASSQVGFAVGVLRGGLVGGIVAWLAFTLPSALLMYGFARYLAMRADSPFPFGGEAPGWLHGLGLVAVAVVAQAVLGMARTLAPDRLRATLAAGAAAAVLNVPTPWTQVAVVVAAGLTALFFWSRPRAGTSDSAGAEERSDREASTSSSWTSPVGWRTGVAALALFLLLWGVPALWPPFGSAEALRLFGPFYRAGALVFGGGHVVLPLLEREVVPTGWVSPEDFMAGYGLAQALPGPLFTFAAFLGGRIAGAGGAAVALLALFLPGLLLVLAALPFWTAVRRFRPARTVLAGVNAAVVGLMLAALYDPLWTEAVRSPADAAGVVVLFLLLHVYRLPPAAVVAAGAGWGLLWAGGLPAAENTIDLRHFLG
ncbi:MAG: Chromate transport protein ChrA [Hydrogenibacillus schlegelii]|uniref:Chromate transport protein ChrA n=1 Tax=Hydrogenibacillus schlegelii TaxID=1484 RepID=A0A2T5GDC7_HYDSH|nr:chromate efflux transporter [Hydrogenibacillus schlegelii]PTQ54189.1 MAG: Chromate transport protein ChrA [Hydrogenibacillus schlegelii]